MMATRSADPATRYASINMKKKKEMPVTRKTPSVVFYPVSTHSKGD
jgi:hypothetical protein